MKTNNSTSSGYTVNFLCKAMQKAKNGSLFFAIITFLFICTLLSCESNSTIIYANQQLINISLFAC